jgi:hypothetical protein
MGRTELEYRNGLPALDMGVRACSSIDGRSDVDARSNSDRKVPRALHNVAKTRVGTRCHAGSEASVRSLRRVYVLVTLGIAAMRGSGHLDVASASPCKEFLATLAVRERTTRCKERFFAPSMNR